MSGRIVIDDEISVNESTTHCKKYHRRIKSIKTSVLMSRPSSSVKRPRNSIENLVTPEFYQSRP